MIIKILLKYLLENGIIIKFSENYFIKLID